MFWDRGGRLSLRDAHKNKSPPAAQAAGGDKRYILRQESPPSLYAEQFHFEYQCGICLYRTGVA